MRRAERQSWRTRPPAVAGLFYPNNPDRLQTDVWGLLAAVAPPPRLTPKALIAPHAPKALIAPHAPKALIAPHAGYLYSGGVAAAAFATLRDSADIIMRVVLIGPAHYVQVPGIAVPTVSSFETPLGRVPVDLQALSTLADLEFVVAADGAHAREHCLEVELPFLQTVLRCFQIVPLVVGDATPNEVAQALRRLWGGPETLIVVSSDLSHYHPYAVAQRLDADTAAAIEHGDWASLGPNRACGGLAVAGLLIEAESHGLKARRLSLCNSGDTAGSRDRVVGYGAWVFAPIDRES